MDETEIGKIDGLELIGYGSRFKEEIGDMLDDAQLFADFSRPEIELLANYIHAFRAKPKTVIIREGRRNNFVCILIDGKLDVLKEVNEGNMRQIATIRAGKTVGEMSIVDELPHSATVVATTEVKLLLLTKSNLARIADEQPRLGFRIAWKIAQLLSHRLRQTSGKLVDFL